jgi:shikimate kinase
MIDVTDVGPGPRGPRGAGAPSGRGEAFGAVTILNATATGIGCALAVNQVTRATWTPGSEGLRATGVPDLRLVEAVAEEMGARRAADVHVACPFPPSRGLKTSSSAAAALVRAVFDADGRASASSTEALQADHAEVERLAVAACRRAGVTLTGALDDQTAAVRGGCHLVDNREGRQLAVLHAPPWQVAVWVPDRAVEKSQVAGIDVAGLRADLEAATELAREGNLAEAMTANGRAFHAAYSAAGLPVDDLPARVALSRGALGAGLSGTGPAVAAVFARRVDLPPVSGGTWLWTRTVPAR